MIRRQPSDGSAGDRARRPLSPMCWRDERGVLLSEWTEREIAILERWLERGDGAPCEAPDLSYAELQDILDAAVGDEPVTALHRLVPLDLNMGKGSLPSAAIFVVSIACQTKTCNSSRKQRS